MPSNDVYNETKQLLNTIVNQYGENVFNDTAAFKAKLIEINPSGGTKRISNLVRIAICDIHAYARLKKTNANEASLIISNIANEMESEYGTDGEVCKAIINAITSILGYNAVNNEFIQRQQEFSVVDPAIQPNNSSNSEESLNIGGYITIGNITWRILNVEEEKALVISETAIDMKPFNFDGSAVAWDKCTLRKHLNGTVYDSFSNEEKNRICDTYIIAKDSAEFGTSGGGNTNDKLFLLSIEEAGKYFADDSDRIVMQDNFPSMRWWLRSPGVNPYVIANVSHEGEIFLPGTAIRS